ncbi:hypothetical protein [Pseudoalteromonas umbrosa]|uniref:hypothetical protein n=1 Tax=Pseudoalteromonas umbrosa TaxID=3048489 RepID=UPI0024C3E171|nr:hypothetical protein [Pseudoalteromonas sp. B95]MDK1290078.1 hypothetical protein [Pseudoalteromonas sp. B95]
MRKNYWVNSNFIHSICSTVRGNYMSGPSSGHRSGGEYDMFFMLSHLEPDALLAQFKPNDQASGLVGPRIPSVNKASAGYVLPPSHSSVNDEGELLLHWPESHKEIYYPMFHPTPTNNEKPQSFLLMMTNSIAAHFIANSYSFRTSFGKFVVYAVGTVGDYQSGADIEFEGLDSWRLGRPLYLENNTLRIPMKVVR